jgi:hypothetical protein
MSSEPANNTISRDSLFQIDDWILYLNWDVRKVAPIEELAEMLRENPVTLLIRCLSKTIRQSSKL